MSESSQRSPRVRISLETRLVIGVAFLISTAAVLGFFGPYRGYRGQPPVQRVVVIYLLPITAWIIAMLIGALQRRRLPAQDNGSADAAIQAIVFWVAFFLTGVHILLVGVLVGAEWMRQPWTSRAVVLLLGVTITAAGNLLPRTRPNMAVGIRTARTLADRQLWILMHRTSGYACVAVGTVTIYASVFLHGEQVAAVPGIAMLAAAALTSAHYWRSARGTAVRAASGPR